MAGNGWRERVGGNIWQETDGEKELAGTYGGKRWMRNGWRERVGGKILRGKGCAKIRHSFEIKNL